MAILSNSVRLEARLDKVGCHMSIGNPNVKLTDLNLASPYQVLDTVLENISPASLHGQ